MSDSGRTTGMRGAQNWTDWFLVCIMNGVENLYLLPCGLKEMCSAHGL